MKRIDNVIVRGKSVITNCPTEIIYTLSDFPIHMMKSENDLCTDLIYEIGINDGFIQLRNTIKAEDLYIDTHSNAIGKTWTGAHNAVSEIIKKYSTDNTEILEIGGATGRLNSIFCNTNGKYLSWEIIEPQPCPGDDCKATFIKGFFPHSVINGKKYDMVIHTHVLEHVENIHYFIESILNCLKTNGKMIFSVPDMEYMINHNVTSILNFEHTMLLTNEYIEYLLKRHGFEINEKESYGNGHSLIYSTTYTGKIKNESLSTDLYIKNKQMFLNYIEFHQEMITKWNDQIEKEERKIFLFGAHISTQYFIAYGLKTEKIVSLLDNDTTKQNNAVSGIDKEIDSPKILKDMGNVVVIIPNNPYRNEIEQDILENINSNVEFWE